MKNTEGVKNLRGAEIKWGKNDGVKNFIGIKNFLWSNKFLYYGHKRIKNEWSAKKGHQKSSGYIFKKMMGVKNFYGG